MLNRQIGVVMYQTSNTKGQELVAQRMVSKFNEMGRKAYLITSIFHDGKEVISPGRMKNEGFVYSRDKELGIPIIRVDSYIANWPPRRIDFRDFISVLEKIVNKFQLDVLITHSTLWNGPEEVAKFIDWRRSMKTRGGYKDPLVFCHMSHFQSPSSERYSLNEKGFRIAWNKFSLPQILATANLILVVTPLEMQEQIELGTKPEKCFLFPGGVDDKLFNLTKIDINKFFKQLKINENTKIVSYLGSLEERKNPLGVLDVARKLNDRQDIHFVIAGKGDSSYAEEVIKNANKLHNVTYLGPISENEKVNLIASSYLNILLSKLEALGLAQIEFMYLGVPVITSAVGGQAWLIQNQIEGIHVNGSEDIEGVALAITKLVDDSELWKVLSANAKKRAENLTTTKLTIELDKAITEELLKERELLKIPKEIRSILTSPDNVLNSWSSGSSEIIVTEEKVYVKSGRISKKIAEIPYKNIASIGYTRIYPWKTLLGGVTVSLLLIFGRLLALTQNPFFEAFLVTVPIVPLLLALSLFKIQAKNVFILQGLGRTEIQIPQKLQEAVLFIRKIQQTQFNPQNSEGKNKKN